MLDVCNSQEFASLPPSQIVPRLADQGRYLASESSFYRILRAADQQHRRGRSQPPRHVPVPTSHTATGPNQVWSWDITYLPSLVRGQYYYLYLIEDIYSRKGVGWEVHEQECGERAAALLQRSIIREQCWKQPLVLHSDNGAPMKSVTLLTKMHDLGVTPSRGRPRVSNDNPYSESLFRTLKYCPQWPSDGFASLEAAREWVRDFMAWYNEEHRHSRIRFVTPNERHRGDVSAAKSTYLPSLYCATFFAMGSSGTFQGSRASSFSRLSASPICASTWLIYADGSRSLALAVSSNE